MEGCQWINRIGALPVVVHETPSKLSPGDNSIVRQGTLFGQGISPIKARILCVQSCLPSSKHCAM